MKIFNHNQPVTDPSDILAVTKILESNMLSKSSVTQSLEASLAEYLGKSYGLFTGNGSQAMALLLEGLGVSSGDEVIMPSYVCEKVLLTVQAIGAKPVLCDTNAFWVVSFESIKSKISKKTKAIIVVHTQGINGYDEQLKTLKIPVIEDTCQSFGSLNKEKRTGSFTDYAFTSFHGTKTLPGGEGGMLFVNDEFIYSKIQKEASNNPRYTKGTDIISALVLSQFNRLKATLEKREILREVYRNNINPELNQDFEKIAYQSMKFKYLLKSAKNFQEVKSQFLEYGIHVRQGVDCLNHRTLGLEDASFPSSVSLYNQTISIPILPSMTENDAHFIASKANEILM